MAFASNKKLIVLMGLVLHLAAFAQDSENRSEAPPAWGFTQKDISAAVESPSFNRLLMTSTQWDFNNQTVKVTDTNNSVDVSHRQIVYSLAYLFQADEDIWIGPLISGGISNYSSGSDSSSIHLFEFGLEFKSMIATKGNAYVSFMGQAQWSTMNEVNVSDSGSREGNYKGPNFGAGLGLGNRIGSTDQYLVEVGLWYYHIPLSGKYASINVENSYDNVSLGISIGRFY